jgi:hypothetical protein
MEQNLYADLVMWRLHLTPSSRRIKFIKLYSGLTYSQKEEKLAQILVRRMFKKGFEGRGE